MIRRGSPTRNASSFEHGTKIVSTSLRFLFASRCWVILIRPASSAFSSSGHWLVPGSTSTVSSATRTVVGTAMALAVMARTAATARTLAGFMFGCDISGFSSIPSSSASTLFQFCVCHVPSSRAGPRLAISWHLLCSGITWHFAPRRACECTNSFSIRKRSRNSDASSTCPRATHCAPPNGASPSPSSPGPVELVTNPSRQSRRRASEPRSCGSPQPPPPPERT